MRILLLVLASFMCAPVLADNGLYNGLVSDGYVYQDGFWMKGGQAFFRQRQAFTVRCGFRNCTSYRYVYSVAKVAVHASPNAQKYAYQSKGWRQGLLELRAEKDRQAAALLQQQEEQKEFLEAVNALGLASDVGYGYSHGNYGSAVTYSAPLAAQGSTLFGYDYYAQQQPSVDLQVLYSQANRLAQSAQSLTSNATADFSALVLQESQNQEKLAEIRAKGEVVAQALKVLQEPPRQEVTVEQWGEKSEASSAEETAPEADDSANLGDRAKLFAVIANRCVSCHGPSKKSAGLDMTAFLSFDETTRQKIVKTLVAEDPDVLMPKGPGGSPGMKLPAEELRLFYHAAGLSYQ